MLEVALFVNLLSSELNSRLSRGNDMLPELIEEAKQAYKLLLEEDIIEEAQVLEAAEFIHEIIHSVK